MESPFAHPLIRCAVVLLSLALGVLLPSAMAQTLAAPPGAPGPAPAPTTRDPAVVVSESDFCRSYYQFGWDRFSPKALKEAKEVAPAIVARLERPSKALLADRQLDWEKEDWRDWAFTYRSLGDPPEITRAVRFAAPAPAGWAGVDFDDGRWPRQMRPMGVGPLHGVLFTERGNLCAGLQVAYHRYSFDVTDPSAAGEFSLAGEYVGGLRVFLNGAEIGRGHLPKGELDLDRTAVEPYPAEAYRWRFDELPQKDQEAIRQKSLKGKPDPEYWGWAGWDIQPGTRLWKLRNRALGPVALPADKLRKGRNVLAVEVWTAPIHPLILEDSAWYSWRGGGSGIPTAWLHGALTRLDLRSARPLPGVAGPATGLRVWAEDVHRRVTSRDYQRPGEDAGIIRLVGARNGAYSAQIVLRADQDVAGVKFTPGEIKGPAALPASCIRVQGISPLPALRLHELGFGRIPVGESFYSGIGACFAHALSWGRYANFGEKLEAVGDVQVFDHITAAVPDKLAANVVQPYWLTVQVPADAAPGVYKGEITVEATVGGKAERRTVPVELEVVNWSLPDPRDLQAVVAIEQSPYAVAKEYGPETVKDGRKVKTWMPLWTDEHFRLIEASLKQLGRVGNDWWFVPVIQGTEFGNRDESMIRWTRAKDPGAPGLRFDFAILDRYLDLIEKHCGRPGVVDFVVMHGSTGPVTVSVLDEATGKTEKLDLSEANPDRAVPWRQFANALYSHMRARGLGEAMHWGYAWDTEGDPRLKDLLRACVPDVFWTYGAHSRGGGSGGRMESDSLSVYRSVVEIYSLDKRIASRMGWKRYPDLYLHNPRNGSACNVTEGFSQPYNYRLLIERSLTSGYNGVGRIGGDYWAGSYFDGCGVTAYNMAGFGIMKTLWPGPNGAEPSARFEGLREGVQETEARIVIEQALDRESLGEELSKRADALLKDLARETYWIPAGVSADFFNEGAQGWLDRSGRLYRMAAEVAAAVGLDVERTALTARVAPQEQRSLPLVLRNWTDKPRAWRAAASEPWIVLDKGEGQAPAGRQVLAVRIDAAKLAPEQKAEGAVTLTNAATGRNCKIKISAEVGKVFEFSAQSVVLNVPLGGQEVREGLSVYNSSAGPIEFKAQTDLGWLQIAPAAGKVEAGQLAFLKLTASPPDKQLARHDGTLTIQVGQAARQVPVTAYVVPPYAEPALRKGTPVWLSDLLDAKKVKLARHVVGGKPGGANWGGNIPGGVAEQYSSLRGKLPYKLRDKTFLRGLWIAATHETVLDLEGSGVTGFNSWVGLSPGIESGKGDFSLNLEAVLCFEIYVDDQLRAQSGPIQRGTGPRLLAVEGLEKAKTLRLATRRVDGVNDPRSTGVWADATCHFASAPPADLAELYRQEQQIWQEPPTETVKAFAFLGALARQGEGGRYGPEEKLNFAATVDGIGGKIAWRAVKAAEDGGIHLESLLKDPANTVSFAAVVLESPQPQLIQLGLGQGGWWSCQAAVHLNGRRVLWHQGGVGVKPNGLRFLVNLAKGPNVLLIRLDETSKTGGLVLTYRGKGVTARMPDGVR